MSALTDSNIQDLPAPIVEKLRSLISRVRRLLFLRGLFATIAAGLTSIIIIMAIDASFTLFSDAARWALSLCGFAFTAGIAWHFLIQPLSRKLTLTRIARILETRHPELQERISSAVELMRSDDPDSIKGSEELIHEVVNSAVIDVKDVEPENEFDNSKTQRFFYAAVTTASIILLLLVIWPRQTGILFARAIAPFLDIGNAYSNTLTVDPGDIRVPIGQSVTVQMSIQNKNIRRVTLRRSLNEDSEESVERMSLLESQPDGTQTFTVTFPSVTESFRYRINAGSAVSRYFNVEAVPLPEVKNLTVTYDYPDYTSLETKEVESENGDISAVEHTEVTVTASLNKAVTRAALSINESLTPAEAVLNAENQTASWTFPLEPGMTGNWQLDLADENDFENIPVIYAIHSVPDRVPEIRIDAPQIRELKLKRSETLPIKYTIKEDYGFSALDLVVRRDDEAQPLEIKQPLPTSGDGTVENWIGNTRLDIGSLELTDKTTKLTVQVRARDNLPSEYEGPHEAYSDPITIFLDINAQSLVQQTMEADRKEIEKALADAKNDLTQARAEVAQAEKQLNKSDNLSPEASRELDEFREKAKNAHETLRDISEKMQQTAFDRQAEQIEQLANDEVAKAREAANMIPLTDEKKERVEKAQEAQKEVEEALKEIAEISKSLQETQPEVQMIAQLNDLASNQRQLARDAAQQAQQSQQAQQKPKELSEQDLQKLAQEFAKWQEQQKNVQNKLGDILNENEAALKDVLKQQKEQAEQLAEKAEQLAKDQEQVAKATQQAAKDNAEEQLRKQLLDNLAREQAAIAKDTSKVNEQSKNSPQQNSQDQAAQDKSQQAKAKEPSKPDSEASSKQDKKSQEMAQTPELNEAVNTTAQAAEALKKENIQQAENAASKAAEALQAAQNAEQKRAEQSEAASEQAKASDPAKADSNQAKDAAAADNNQQLAQKEPGKDSQADKQQAQAAEPAAQKQQMAQAESSKAPAKPQSPSARKLGELKERQESVNKQLESIKEGKLEEALTMQEEQLAREAEQLAQETDSFENNTRMAKQNNAQRRAQQAESQLNAGKQQADRASQQLTQAKQAQERAEQIQRQQQKDPEQTPLSPQTKQALAQSERSQKDAENRFKAAAKDLQQAAKDLANSEKGLSSEKMKSEALEGKELAESFQDVSQASDAQDNQQAAEKAQKAADSLQQLAQAALEKLAGQNQPQDSQQDGSQMSDPRDSESIGKQELNEGGKVADMDGSGVPPELAKLGITFSDWARLKGTLQAGSSNQNSDTIPAEYRDLVQRYFKVIAAEAAKDK